MEDQEHKNPRYFCPHCKSMVAKSTFFDHKLRFYDSMLGRWEISTPDEPFTLELPLDDADGGASVVRSCESSTVTVSDQERMDEEALCTTEIEEPHHESVKDTLEDVSMTGEGDFDEQAFEKDEF